MKKYNLIGTLYFLYPPIVCSTDEVTSRDFKQALSQYEPGIKPLCLYVHFPFCIERCYYCYAYTTVGKHEGDVWRYLEYLKKNIDLVIENSNVNNKKINAMNLGGGSPTYLTSKQLKDIYQYICNYFEFEQDAELAIEIDTRVTTAEKLETIASLGIKRLSFGMQEANKKVLQSVNRDQNMEDIQDQINFSRSLGINNINIDLMIGLPNQSLSTFNETLDMVLELNPNQITFNNYEHMPFLLPHQAAIKEEELPDEKVKLDILNLAEEKLPQHGYKNHAYQYYARTRDELWHYYNKYIGCLDSEWIAFGPFCSSFINKIRVSHFDDLESYYEMLDNNQFPVKNGFKYSKDDLIRNYVVHYMQSNQGLDKKVIEDAYSIDFDDYFEKELNELKEMEEDGLLIMHDDQIKLTQGGRIYITNILMVFDKYPHWKEILSLRFENL
jgi:oxygen-independent coproporphyrinogen-3 oxidase